LATSLLFLRQSGTAEQSPETMPTGVRFIGVRQREHTLAKTAARFSRPAFRLRPGGLPGPIVAVRSELDALPVTEDSNLPFKSTVRSSYNDQEVGVAHACGHDIHIAAIIGVATVLASMRQQLHGTVIFIFQPAEEGAPKGEEGGAALMLKEGLFGDLKPEAVFGMHSIGTSDVGKISYSLGGTTASGDNFRILFHGKQAHAAFPQYSIDPVVMAAEAVMQLQTIRSRNLSPYDPAVLSVTMVHTGVRNNIIPDHCNAGWNDPRLQ
jgi:amidohydrolase